MRGTHTLGIELEVSDIEVQGPTEILVIQTLDLSCLLVGDLWVRIMKRRAPDILHLFMEVLYKFTQ